MEEKLLDEEDAAHELSDVKKKMEAEQQELKKDIEELEGALTKVCICYYWKNKKNNLFVCVDLLRYFVPLVVGAYILSHAILKKCCAFLLSLT